MINTGKCPNCNAVITNVRHEHVTVGQSLFGQKEWHGISYVCPSCSTVLSVQIDPVALYNDTVDKTVERLLAALRR
jgi:uncharacterized protein with PIN domain